MTGSIDLASTPLPQLTGNVSGNGNAAATSSGGNSVFADLLQSISAVPAGAANTPNNANAALLGIAANASTATAPTPTSNGIPATASASSNDGTPELFSIDQLQALLKAQVMNTPSLSTSGKQLSTTTPTNRTTPATTAPASSQNATLCQTDDTSSDPLAPEMDVLAALVEPQTAPSNDTAAPQSSQANTNPMTAPSTPKFAFVDVGALQMAPMAPQDPNDAVQQPSLPLMPVQNGKSDDTQEPSEVDRSDKPTTASNDNSQPLVTATIIAGQMAVMVQAPAVHVDVSNSPVTSAMPDRTDEKSGDNNSTGAIGATPLPGTAKSSVSNASNSLSTNSANSPRPTDSFDASMPQFDVDSAPSRQPSDSQAQAKPEDTVSVVSSNQVNTTVAQAIAAAQPMTPAQTTRATSSLENVSASSATHPSDANSVVTITSFRQPSTSVTTPTVQASTPNTVVLPPQTVINSARTSTTVQLPQTDKIVLPDFNLQVIEQTNQFVQSAGDQGSDGMGHGQIAVARHTLPPIAAHEALPSENFASNLSSATPLNFAAAPAQQPAPAASIVGRILEAIPKPLQATTIVIHAEGYGPIQIRISPESSSPDASWRITIRTSDPAAHALLKESVDEIRQNLKSDAVNIVGTTAATEKTSGPAGSSNNGSSLKDSGQERHQQFEQKNSRNRSRGEEVFTIPEIDE